MVQTTLVASMAEPNSISLLQNPLSGGTPAKASNEMTRPNAVIGIFLPEQEYREWFDVNYSEYKFWEGIGITQERFDQIVLEIQSEPKPKMVQTGFVLVPDDEKSFPLVEETYEPEPQEIEPVKEEKKGFFDWLFDLFN